MQIRIIPQQTKSFFTQKSKVAANQRAVNWFMREVENMKVLKHPNVVGLKEFGYADETFFFTRNTGTAAVLWI